MKPIRWSAGLGGLALVCGACNSGAPEPASADIPSTEARLTIVRMATDPFLSRHSLKLLVEGRGGCSSSTELFPDTGHASRRNIYLAAKGMVYVVGQFDARVIDSHTCQTSLSSILNPAPPSLRRIQPRCSLFLAPCASAPTCHRLTMSRVRV